MKKHLLTLLLSAGFIAYASIQSVNDNSGKNGSVGSPGEATCASSGCHNDNSVNAGAGGIAISSSNMSNWQYTPGQTYNISISIGEGGKSIFGFGFEALDSANNSVGTIIVTKSGETSLHNTSYLGGTNPAGRINIGHVKNGGVNSNSKTFNFDWKAPNNYCGNIRFYAVGTACNRDGSASGDNVYTSAETVTPAATGIIGVVGKLAPFSSFVATHSVSQTMYVSGEYLNDSVTVVAPSGYEVSLALGREYADSIKLGPTSNSLRLSPIYIRLKPTNTGTISGNIVISGGGASSVSVAVTGAACSEGVPKIGYQGNLVPFAIAVGNNSASQTISVSANNLTTDATFNISAPFKICATQGGTYANSLTLTPTNGSIAATNLFIKYYPTTTGTHNSSLTISSTGATTQTISMTGTASANNAAAIYVQTNFDPFVTNKVGIPSAAQTFLLDATSISTSVVLAAPTHFEISKQSTSGYAKVLSLTPSNNTISAQTIYIRYNPLFEANEYEDFNIACSSFATKFISVVGYVAKAQGNIKITIEGKDSICNGGSTTMEVSGATSYNWQPSNLSASTITLSTTQTTTYTVTGTTGSQTAKGQFIVNVLSTPVADFSTQANDSDVSFSNTSTYSSSYSWDFGDGQTSTLANPKHIYNAAGTYKVFIKSNGLCGTDSITQTVTVTLAPTIVAISGNNSICKGDSTNLTATGATSYSWQPGNITTSSMKVSPLQTTTYSVTGTSGSQTANAQFTVNVKPLPKAAFTSKANDSDITFTNNSNNAGTYLWDFGDGVTSGLPSPEHIYTKLGTYKVSIKVTGACGTDTTSQYIKIYFDTTTKKVDTTTHHNASISNPNITHIDIYPNPANRNIQFNIKGKATVKLYSIDGKLVYNTNISNMNSGPFSLSLPDLKNGIYIINIQKENGETYQTKFMIDN